MDVPSYVALVTAGASVISGAIPLAVNWARDAGREKRASVEQRAREETEHERHQRQQCVSLLKLTRDFRVLIENAYGPQGSVSRGAAPGEASETAGRVRQFAADIASQADQIDFMVPGVENEVLALARAAGLLVSAAEDKHREHGRTLEPGDFTELDERLTAFKLKARGATGELQERGRERPA